jgi:DNA-binding IclR family transcriptional regulator
MPVKARTMSKPEGSRTIAAIDTTCEIIGALQNQNGGTISDLAEEIDVSSATIHAHLASLKKHGLVSQTHHSYDLGPRLLALGEHVRNNSTLYEAAKDEVERLATETGECAHLIIQHNGKLYALYERFGENAVGIEFHDRKRERPINHLHCTAAGKAILANLPKSEVTDILESHGMPRRTPKTFTDREALFKDLERIRERGFALADEEQMKGIRAVGVPVKSPTDEVIGALALSGPTTRLKDDLFKEDLPNRLMRAANVAEVNLQTTTLDGDLD